MTPKFEVCLRGWMPGVKTISLMELLREAGNMSLTASKDAVDRLLDGESHLIGFATLDEARAFQIAATDLGAIADLRV